MFEKPKSLAELSESELTSIVLYLNDGFDGGAPDPGYSWEEHFQDDSDYEGEGVPPWFNGWIKNFTSDDLITMDSHDGSVTLSLLKDQGTQQFRAYSFNHSQECPPIFFGWSAYLLSKLNSETVWPLVQGHFDSDSSYSAYLLDECDLVVVDRDLIPQAKIVEFLKKAYIELHDEPMNPDDPKCMEGSDRISLNEWIRKNYKKTN